MNKALEDMLAPYCGRPEDPVSASSTDTTDEYREEWETGKTDRVKCPDGALVWPWDERFRVKGTFGQRPTRSPDKATRRSKCPSPRST